jgi:hypothetical protein
MIISYYPGAGGTKFCNSISGTQWQTHGIAYDKKTHDMASDNLWSNETSQPRYLDENSVVAADKNDFILTHCVNTPLIKKLFQTQTIVCIVFPLKDCLRREWRLAGQDRYRSKLKHLERQNSMLDLYHAIKDDSWIEITNVDELEVLSQNIKDELTAEYIKNQPQFARIDAPLARLKQKYEHEIESAFEQITWHKDYYDRYPLDLSHAAQVIELCDCSEFSLHMQHELGLYTSQTFDDCWSVIYE